MSTKLYQDCNLAERIWRRRWYLVIPLYVAQSYLYDFGNEFYFGFKDRWLFATGLAQVKMNWVYSDLGTKLIGEHD